MRVYYTEQEDIQKLVPFDLFEFNDKEEKYVLVAATQSEIERIQAAQDRMFQFTHPRGVRLPAASYDLSFLKSFNSRTRVGCDRD